jgi:hypothetical protein
MLVCHDELVVECPGEQAEEVTPFLRRPWPPGWRRF